MTRIVLADDHRLLREALRRALTDEGFDVVGEASDGAEAVAVALDTSPDVVLMDVSMPRLDGVSATRQLKELAPDIRVLMLTMHGDGEVVADAVRAGASGYLVKDCSTDEIAAAVRMVAAGETVLSPQLAASMLGELRRIEHAGEDNGGVISHREVEVLQLIADGCSTPDVAEKLYISQKTVKNHLASIYQKLDARDRTHAVVQAVRLGIIQLT